MTTASWAVVGHRDRFTAAWALQQQLDGLLLLDTGGLGEWPNHQRAWRALCGRDTEWSVVVQDDALPVREIGAQALAALATATTPVVSFYLGQSYPPETVRVVPRAIMRADFDEACWITAKRLFWGVAVAIRTELVADMLAVAGRLRGVPYDERVSYWAGGVGGVGYTWPSLVDHADGPTLVEHRTPRVLPRRAYRVTVRDEWSRRAVKL